MRRRLSPGQAVDAHLLRLELVLRDILARDLDEVPAIVESPQLMPGFGERVPPGWAVGLVPHPARTRLVQEDRLAKEEALAGRLSGRPVRQDHIRTTAYRPRHPTEITPAGRRIRQSWAGRLRN